MKYSIVFRLLIHHTYFYTLWVVYILHFNNIQFIRLHVLITDSSRFYPWRASKNFLSTGPQFSHFFSFSLLLSLFAVSDFQWLSFTCQIPLVSFRGTDAHKADRKPSKRNDISQMKWAGGLYCIFNVMFWGKVNVMTDLLHLLTSLYTSTMRYDPFKVAY